MTGEKDLSNEFPRIQKAKDKRVRAFQICMRLMNAGLMPRKLVSIDCIMNLFEISSIDLFLLYSICTNDSVIKYNTHYFNRR